MAIPSPVGPSTGEVWEFVVRGRDLVAGTAIINRLRWRYERLVEADPSDVTEPQRFCDALKVRWRATIRTLLTNTYDVDRYSLQRLIGATIIPGTGKAAVQYDQRRDSLGEGAADTGSRAGTPEPNFVTAGLYWGTVLVSRNTRTMMRLSPVPDADIDAGLIVPAYQALMIAAGDTLRAVATNAPTNAKWTPVVWSSTEVARQDPPPAINQMYFYTSDIIGCETASLAGHQVSRKNNAMG